METYTELKELVKNPYFRKHKAKALAGLTNEMIDRPIVELINGFNRLPYCFTLQCCYGHFVYEGQNNLENLEPLPLNGHIAQVEYRIAYVTFCIEKNIPGLKLFNTLKEITAIDPDYVQFFCAEWFWNKQVNSYALQVEPDRFKDQDTAIVDFKEALHIEKIRNEFITRLYSNLSQM